MDFRFIPVNLIKAKEEIALRHTEFGEESQTDVDSSFMNFIKYLVCLEVDEVEKEALVITKRMLEKIVRYLPHNYYNVQMDNLFLIFRIRSNLKFKRMLFNEWQNGYSNESCNAFLKTFVSKDKDFGEILDSNHISVQMFTEILSAKNIAIKYGKTAMSLERSPQKSLAEKLEYLGIRKTSKLFNDCLSLFYVFCERKDYLSVDDEKILSIIKKYDNNLKKQFLANFLGQLSLSELKNYKWLASYFFEITGENHSKKFNSYFASFEPDLTRKYVNWMHIYIINKIFGKDERSVFWERYHYELVTKYTYSNAVVMEFVDYVAVEFLGQAMGPLYIYQKKYFEADIRKFFKLNMYDNGELRTILYNNTKYENNAKRLKNKQGTRLVHLPNPGWQTNFHGILITNKITERIL